MIFTIDAFVLRLSCRRFAVHTLWGDQMSTQNSSAARRLAFMTTASTVAMLASSFAAQAQTAPGQQAQAPAVAVDEITVTGTRVVRDGYEAPTPVTVIGVEQIEAAPMQHLSDFVMRLPAFAGAQSMV